MCWFVSTDLFRGDDAFSDEIHSVCDLFFMCIGMLWRTGILGRRILAGECSEQWQTQQTVYYQGRFAGQGRAAFCDAGAEWFADEHFEVCFDVWRSGGDQYGIFRYGWIEQGDWLFCQRRCSLFEPYCKR